MNKILRSPFFYVGDKFKLMKELKPYFPEKVDRFIEPFTGGGTVFLNINAREYFLNDINNNIRDLHEFLIKSSTDVNKFFKETHLIVKKYGLSRSFFEDIIPVEMKRNFKKTYYAQFNKEKYRKLRMDYNTSMQRNPIVLYLLLIYGFNRMLRFNSNKEFNIPVGNVDFNKNVVACLNDYFNFVKEKRIKWSSHDFRVFLSSFSFKQGDFIYLDPPYLISFSEYNKLWNEETEMELLKVLDELTKKGVKFTISNIIYHKGRKNKIFKEWMQQKEYNVFKIKSNYISYHDNTTKNTEEVLVTNYDPKKSGV